MVQSLGFNELTLYNFQVFEYVFHCILSKLPLELPFNKFHEVCAEYFIDHILFKI